MRVQAVPADRHHSAVRHPGAGLAHAGAAGRLRALTDSAAPVGQLAALQRMADLGRQASAVGVLQAAAVVQFERVVSNSQAQNMRASLARVFGGKPGDYVIDQNTGKTFPDNNGQGTVGHHGVSVTDTRDGGVYSCDFHQNGKYYTRG